MRKVTTLRLIGSLVASGAFVMLAVSAAGADDTDIFGANVQPNVMLMLDNSGSMFDTIVSHPYDAATDYAMVAFCGSKRDQQCVSTRTGAVLTGVVYQQPKANTYTLYSNTIAAVGTAADQPARDALTSTGFWSGKIGGSQVNLFVGNYLNYQLGFCPTAPCSERKIDIAKRTLKNLITNTPGVRFGVMKFGNNGTLGAGGGAMVAQIGTVIATMKTAIDGISPSGFTPLGEFMYDAGQYYKGLPWRNGLTYTTPIQPEVGECQPNFVILISDGLQNGTMDVRTEAGLRFTQDHSSVFAGKQNVIVHTVGFGIGASEPGNVVAANDVLKTAAQNGGGQFYDTNNAAELEAALQDAIRKVLAATFTFATPVLPSTSTTGSSRAYLAAFQSDPSSPFWRGFLKAYQRDANGQVPVETSGPNIGQPLASAKVWDAGEKLSMKTASTRNIYTVTGGTVTGGTMTGATRQDFTTSNAAITAILLNVAATERDNVINFTRGIDAYDEDLDTNKTEERGWKLGDIFHSSPVLVTPPGLPLNDISYKAFKLANASRTTVLIAGANDGMLHAFRESDGEELWAFIPPDLLDTLSALTVRSGNHPYSVDSSPIAADIKIGGNWKTIVIFGLRRGGNFYYALDITDTTNPLFLWSFTDSKMGETWSEPAVGKVKIGGSDKFVAFVGGGYDTGTNNASGKAFFVIDLATGQKLWEYYNSSSSDDRQYMNFSLTANPIAADLTNDGYVDRIYIGDVGGQLWKFDVSSQATTAEWTGKRLFAAASSQANPPPAGAYYPTQAIYGAPTLARDENMNLWVFIGSGDRNHPNNTASNRFYGIKDTTTMTNGAVLTEAASLVDVTTGSVTAADVAAAQGWVLRLASNEKVLSTANVFNKVVFFSTFTPSPLIACGNGGGSARLYALQMETGFAGIDFATGQALTSSDTSRTRSTVLGQGIASMPVIVITYPPPGGPGTISATVVTATTSQQLPNNPVPPPAFLKQLLYWRELLGS